jgi:hypothetical protein
MSTTITTAQFRERFPEFGNLPDSMIEQRISWAEAETDEGIWGDNRPIGIGFLTAHYCAMTPRGEDMRLKNSKQEPTTFYEIQFKKLMRKVAGGARLAILLKDFNRIRNSIR